MKTPELPGIPNLSFRGHMGWSGLAHAIATSLERSSSDEADGGFGVSDFPFPAGLWLFLLKPQLISFVP